MGQGESKQPCVCGGVSKRGVSKRSSGAGCGLAAQWGGGGASSPVGGGVNKRPCGAGGEQAAQCQPGLFPLPPPAPPALRPLTPLPCPPSPQPALHPPLPPCPALIPCPDPLP